MNEKLNKTFTITNNLYDTNDILKPSSVFDLSQEISGDHANLLKCGFNEFIAQDLIWVVVRNYLEIIEPIKFHSKLKLETYPLPTRFVEYPREVKYFDEGGKLLAVSKSIWMILNVKNFEIQTPHLFDNLDLNLNEPYFKTRIKKLPIIKKENLIHSKNVEVTFSMLDHNGHLNNTRYLDMFLDVFEPDNYIKSVQVEYVKQSFLRDVLSLYKYEDGEDKYLYGYKDDELRFYMKVTFGGKINEN